MPLDHFHSHLGRPVKEVIKYACSSELFCFHRLWQTTDPQVMAPSSVFKILHMALKCVGVYPVEDCYVVQ